MKKKQVTILFDDEKLSAARMFLSQKGLSLEAELEGYALSLYKKHVPSGVREFIGMKSAPPEKKTKPKAPAPPENGTGGAV
jgi:hypothetical protein